MTATGLHPHRSARVRTMSQDDIDLGTIMAPPGAFDETLILSACARLKYSRDWTAVERARAVEAAVFSLALEDDLPPRRVTLDSIVFAAGVVVAAATLAALAYQSWLNFWEVTERLVM